MPRALITGITGQDGSYLLEQLLAEGTEVFHNDIRTRFNAGDPQVVEAMKYWAGLTVHGMLTRIIPFLLWFHRFSRLVGLAPVPPMNRLLPERTARISLGLHLATLLLGLAAIASGWSWLARGTGVLLLATGIALGTGLWRAVQHRTPQVAGQTPA